jgi:hypothetical protein
MVAAVRFGKLDGAVSYGKQDGAEIVSVGKGIRLYVVAM